MIKHPDQFSMKFIANLFKTSESNIKGYNYQPVGAGQVGDCYRVNIVWKNNTLKILCVFKILYILENIQLKIFNSTKMF